MANVLAHSLRTDLQNALNSAVSDADVSAIVLAASGADFSSGVDITDYDGPPKSPWINDLCLQIEACPKPVVAALHGAVLGGGAELAWRPTNGWQRQEPGSACPKFCWG